LDINAPVAAIAIPAITSAAAIT
jgi:hypothetical protein